MIIKKIQSQAIVWFPKTNNYIVIDNKAATILKEIESGLSFDAIANRLENELDVPFEKAIDFVIRLHHDLYEPNQIEEKRLINDYKDISKPNVYKYCIYYKINNTVINALFENKREFKLIHPKFAHLEVKNPEKVDTLFEAFSKHSYIFLYVDENFVGSWSKKQRHYFQGKYAMEMVQKIHKKSESEWIATFHASALAKNEKAVLFLGESGSGKSTSLALLQANGYSSLADDFVPFAKENKHVYAFPSAISIKKNSVRYLIDIYPELLGAKEYHLKALNKIVRYLKPNNSNFSENYPCKDLVFITYKKNANLEFEKIDAADAFKMLIPDSWISSIPENVACFLNWFSTLHYYQLTYSKTEDLLDSVSKIFSNEL